MITVRAGRMPGNIEDYEVNEGATVNDVLAQANLDPNGFEIRVDGENADLGDTVEAGQSVLLVRKVKGND